MPETLLESDTLLYQLITFHFSSDLEWMYDEGLTLSEVDPHLAESINKFIIERKGA